MRLPRDRKGKTPIDIGVVVQQSGPRVRVSIGEDWSNPSAKKNSDLSFKETEDLITMLQYHLHLARTNTSEAITPDV